MGTSFLSLNTPDKAGLKNYRISLKVLATAYFVLSFLTIIVLIFGLSDETPEIFTFVDISISSIQALLFSFTLITLLNPEFVKAKNIIRHLIPFLTILALYFISFFLYGDPELNTLSQLAQNTGNPTVWVRLLFLGYFIFQLFFYTRMFLRESGKYERELLDYFSEVIQLKMKWLQIAFFSAALVGIIALVSNFFPMKFQWIFTLIFTLFYFGFAQEFIKYNKLYDIIEPAILSESSIIYTAPHRSLIKTDWQHYKQQIISGQFYRETGVNIEDLARKLNIGRTTLSNIINREEGVNFNSWINRLRIEDAKKLMIEKPDCNIAIISEMVGYTEQANFSRQFKQITGESPLYWRKKTAS